MNSNSESRSISSQIASAARVVKTIAPLLPDYETVKNEIALVEAANERGYFTPDEDERIRELFATYLRTRAGLMSTLNDLKPLVLGKAKVTGEHEPQLFTIAFCTACLLVRSGRFLVDNFRKQPLIRKKLDEAEPRYGIPPKQFTQIYKSLTSPANIWIFLRGIRLAEEKSADIEALRSHPELGPVVEILEAEKPFIETSRKYYTTGRLKYRWYSFLRTHKSGFKNVTFSLFKLSGSLIAELRMKWKRKRVTPGVIRKISRMLLPGDIIITRHDDATSNLFLPGFWPHGALYIGTEPERRALGVSMAEERWSRSGEPIRVLEARKDGVLFRPLTDTFDVDCFTVIRPKLSEELIAQALTRAITHEGKDYDFEFDFRRSNKLVCTEVAYRAYHGIGPMEFQLSTRAGRVCLSAEDLLDCAVENDGLFNVIAIYGCGGNRFVTGERATEVLISSYKKD